MYFDKLKIYFQDRLSKKLILSNNKDVLLENVVVKPDYISLLFRYNLNDVTISIERSTCGYTTLSVPDLCLGNYIMFNYMKFNKSTSLLYYIKYSLENWVEFVEHNSILKWK